MIYYINRVQAASRQEKTDLARFGLPFLQRWVMWAASALMCSAMVYHPKVQRWAFCHWGVPMVDNSGCRHAYGTKHSTNQPWPPPNKSTPSFWRCGKYRNDIWKMVKALYKAPIGFAKPKPCNSVYSIALFLETRCEGIQLCFEAHKLPVKERRAKPPREGQGTPVSQDQTCVPSAQASG